MKPEHCRTLDIRREYPAPPLPRQQVAAKGWKNGLVVRMPNWLGDAVMALPALWQLKQILPPNAALGVIIPNGLRSFFHSLSWVDVIFPLAEAHRNWSREEIAAIRRFSPGAGVLFNNSLRDVCMLRLGGVSELYGGAARGRGFLLRGSFRFPPRRDHALNRLHHSNKYLAIATALGAPPWDGTLPPIDIARPSVQLRAELRALCDHPRMLILAAGAAYGAAKRYPSERFNFVARHWIGRGGIVIAVGSRDESSIGTEIGVGLPANKYTNLMGETDLCELMHLLRAARAVVANDSGVMHLAAALGKPGVAIFGSTDFTATGPIHPGWRILYSGRDCSPCFKRCCPRNSPQCMSDILPESVTAALDAITRTP
ncbi:MAG: lipopolysaccharide heptosyltransferase II [Victivallaceae bacterium]